MSAGLPTATLSSNERIIQVTDAAKGNSIAGRRCRVGPREVRPYGRVLGAPTPAFSTRHLAERREIPRRAKKEPTKKRKCQITVLVAFDLQAAALTPEIASDLRQGSKKVLKFQRS